MAGRKHHTVPQFLLRAFASRTSGKEAYVWTYRGRDTAIEINIKNIGAERDFYGHDLDARITDLETGFAPLAEALRSCDGPVEIRETADLVAHLTLRTRALRQSAIALAAQMTDRMREHFSNPDVLKAAVRKKMPNSDVLKRLRESMAKEGLKKYEIERRILAAGPKILQVWNRSIDDRAEEMASVVDSGAREAMKGHSESMRASFIDALSSGLEDNPRIRAYREFTWSVHPTTVPLILGDSVCVFEVGGERAFKPWDDETTPTKRIFMPLSPDRLLIGSRDDMLPPVDVPALNRVISRCSLEFFVSSKPTDCPDLPEFIGVWSGIATNSEFNAVWDQIKDDW
jgi:hypothetical protein